MKKLFLFAAVAGLGLVSASPPEKGGPTGPGETAGGYPPCSRTVRDECIQLYERGVRTPENLARNDQAEPPTRVAEASYDGSYCRCRHHRAHHRAPHRQLAQHIRRAGERG